MRTHPYTRIIENYTTGTQPMCPHMQRTSSGDYVPATLSSIIEHRGEQFEIMTCCGACAQQIAMKPELYLVFEGDEVYAKHKDTGEKVQKVKRIDVKQACLKACGNNMDAVHNSDIQRSCLCVPKDKPFVSAKEIVKRAPVMKHF